ncbi:hypothetical protein QQY66_20550 [Streptomyces sp. DG2A-72]|uniref:hypothetical protein n=1 Tax=Streptomyces sp. DG2A-72 TaxID=3051386 RepID=UPI00265C5B04|nr:hypothetical protein [Streptomyces sp. DG2A-72]MDO0933956.1 hypothetical protein [Streptomyces sp. DG2A-72]
MAPPPSMVLLTTPPSRLRTRPTAACRLFGVGAFPGSGQSVNYLHSPVPQLDTAPLDQFHHH